MTDTDSAADPPSSGEVTANRKGFGTFTGVFTPTILTILGVIMYLRLGWVIGNAGLVGGLLIIGISIAITTSTGLSLSSIATNTRLGAGGPYAIISKSLGLEVGGSVGVPLYLSQALAVAMYVFGFREGWTWVFPDHPPLLVDLATFLVVFGIAMISASLAFKIQYVVMAVIVGSLVVVFFAPVTFDPVASPTMIGTFAGSPENDFSGVGFWTVFAVFFPAATGIMAGANMSGELENPRRAIPVGTMSAIGVSGVIYVLLAVWISRAGTPEELVSNYTLMIDRSWWPPLVVAGLLGATFSSALSSLVGAPRILAALGHDRILPGGEWVSRTAANGEPRRGMLVTGLIVLGALMLRDLNLIAPLITMFFLIAYAVINIVMLTESSLGLMSFRPTLQLPRIVPLLGTVGCIFAMFVVNPTFSLIAWGIMLAIYAWIMRLGRSAGGTDDVRSGIFVALAEWAASRVVQYDVGAARAWKPSLLVPVTDAAQIRGDFQFLKDVCLPEGSLKLLGVATEATVADMTPRIETLGKELRKDGVFTTWSVIDSAGLVTGVTAGVQALRSAFFRPNVLFLTLPEEPGQEAEYVQLVREAKRLKMAVLLVAKHETAGMGRERVVNLWFRPPTPGMDVRTSLEAGNMNLGILIALRLARSWEAELNLIHVVPDEASRERVEAFDLELRDLCRIPRDASTRVLVGTLDAAIPRAPQSDLDIMGLQPDPSPEFVRRMVRLTRSSCIFVNDSGKESALA